MNENENRKILKIIALVQNLQESLMTMEMFLLFIKYT